MSSWRDTTLGEALEVKHGYAFKGQYFADEGPAIVLTPGNFYEGGGFKSKSGAEKYYVGPVPNGYLLRQGDVVVAMTEQAEGLLGSSATIPEDDRYLHNQRIGLLQITDPARLDQRFCYHLMNTPSVRGQIRATATGSKVRHTAPERICAVHVALPDVETQRVIAWVLDAMDQIIENARRQIQVLDEMAKAIYREWFVHLRFPGYESAKMSSSGLGPMPEGWQVTRLADVANVNRASRVPHAGEEVIYLDISCLGDGSVDMPTSIDGGDAPGRARRVVAPGDVLWSMVRPNRRAHALLVDPRPECIASTGLAVLSPAGVPSSFLFEAVSTSAFSEYLMTKERGAAYPAVRPADFEAAQLLVPPPELLQQFDDVADPLHRLGWKLREQSRALSEIRDLVLPRFVSGQVELSTLDLKPMSKRTL
jgi:type I restriction enzyme S subunit